MYWKKNPLRQNLFSIRFLFIIGLMIVLLVGCNNANNPAADSANAAVISGPSDLQKVLVTVWFSPTPDIADQAFSPSPPVNTVPTLTDEPPEPTRTPTPYVGVFSGTQVDGTPIDSVPPLDISSDGGVLPGNGVSIPQSGVISTTVGTSNCGIPINDRFAAIYTQNTTIAQQLGCPSDSGNVVNLVHQPFERGDMFWRETTRQIYTLRSDRAVQIVVDNWQDGQPADDPNLIPPAGLLQPIRGFGLAWRNGGMLNTIGWALRGESVVGSFWQDFERGAMFIGNDNLVYVLVLSSPTNGSFQGPFTP